MEYLGIVRIFSDPYLLVVLSDGSVPQKIKEKYQRNACENMCMDC